MKKSIYFTLIAYCFFISCSKDYPAKPTSNPEVRIFNATPWTFYNCTVDPSGSLSDNASPNAYNFGEINVNEKSSYKEFVKLYRYSWVKLTMNNKTYFLKPYDYFGETPLPGGRYTYKLTYTGSSDNLNLELIKD